MRIDSKRYAVLQWLRKGNKATVYEGVNDLGVANMAGHISKLRKDGYEIVSSRMFHEEWGQLTTHYTLASGGRREKAIQREG